MPTLLQQRVWSGSLPLEIRLAAADCRTFDDSQPFLIQFSRLAYFGLLLDRLYSFFRPALIDPGLVANDAWLEFEGVPLKWHYPLGLLYDLYAGAQPVDLDSETVQTLQLEHDRGVAAGPIPWRITIHYTEFPFEHLIQLDAEDKILRDSWVNSIKEADFLRNGTARAVMSLSKDDSDNLWAAVCNQDREAYTSINNKLLRPSGLTVKHVPLKIYLPMASSRTTQTVAEEQPEDTVPKAGHFRVVQALTPLRSDSGTAQTVGTALNSTIPDIFPSRRRPLLAKPVLHGAMLPMAAPLEGLAQDAAYLDGFIHLAVVMLT